MFSLGQALIQKMQVLGNRLRQHGRPGHVLLGVILAGGLGLRIHHLEARSFWFDEAFTWRMIEFPLTEMLERASRDNSPPFYYLLLKAWAQLFGTSPIALRSLSVLCGMLTIIGTYVFCREAYNKTYVIGQDSSTSEAEKKGLDKSEVIGLLAAGLVAVSAFQIRYSWETRMYALAAALTVFSGWALLRALRSPTKASRWGLYAILALMLAYTHYYGYFTLAGQGVFVIGFFLVQAKWHFGSFFRIQGVGNSVATAIIILAVLLPWLPIFWAQKAQVQLVFWSEPITFWEVTKLCYRMFAVPEFELSPSRTWQLIVAGACVVSIVILCCKARVADWFVLSSALAPLLFCFLASQLGTHTLTLRYFLMAHVFWLIGLAVLVCRIPFFLERGIIASFFLGGFFFILLEFLDRMDLEHRPGARAAVAFLDQQRKPGETVIVSSPLFYLPLIYYATNRSDYFLYTDGQLVHYHGTAVLSAQELVTDTQLTNIRGKRVWLVDMASDYWGWKSIPPPANWVQRGSWPFNDLFGIGRFQVIEYEAPVCPSRK